MDDAESREQEGRSANPRHRIVEIELDTGGIVRWNPDVQQELNIAIFDLKEENSFKLLDVTDPESVGPFHVTLSIAENRLVMDVKEEGGDLTVDRIILAMTPFRRIIRDYFAVCESYYQAIRTASPSQIEAIDMGRRGLHNEGSDLLRDRLDGKAEIDFDTARRLFTLICVLHIRA